VLSANLRPILPKHTQLQNSTLIIQIPPSMPSLLTYPPRSSIIVLCWTVAFLEEEAGLGIMSGFETRRSAVPVAPTPKERMKPGLERSIMYHRTGLTSANVSEACRVEVHGSFLCRTHVSQYSRCRKKGRGGRTIAKAIPTKAPTLRMTGVQSAPKMPEESSSTSSCL
jgi:hypothetical protein